MTHISAESKLFEDILKQPAQLALCLQHMLGAGKPLLDKAAAVLRRPRPILIVGIGASWHAGMAMQAVLMADAWPALLVDAAELLHSGEIPQGATVVLLSRSGKSTEIVQLIDKCRAKAAMIIAITNAPDSPLAQAADIVLNTATDFDHAVSVTTYSAIAMAGLLLATEALGQTAAAAEQDLLLAFDAAAAQIPAWRQTLANSGWLADPNSSTYFLARGAGLASCHEARLLWEEAAKNPATALTSSGFRHGPQEIVRPGLRIGMWLDAERMRSEDIALAHDLKKLGARVLLIGQGVDAQGVDCAIVLPAIPAPFQCIIEIIPIQLAAEMLAHLRGQDPDSFRLCAYIVEDEGGLSKSSPS